MSSMSTSSGKSINSVETPEFNTEIKPDDLDAANVLSSHRQMLDTATVADMFSGTENTSVS